MCAVPNVAFWQHHMWYFTPALDSCLLVVQVRVCSQMLKKRKIRQACVWNSFLFLFSKNEFSFNRCLWDLALSRIFTDCWQWLRQFSAAVNFIWTSLACTVDDLLDVQGCFLGLDCDLISAFKREYESNWQLVFLYTPVQFLFYSSHILSSFSKCRAYTC